MCPSTYAHITTSLATVYDDPLRCTFWSTWFRTTCGVHEHHEPLRLICTYAPSVYIYIIISYILYHIYYIMLYMYYIIIIIYIYIYYSMLYIYIIIYYYIYIRIINACLQMFLLFSSDPWSMEPREITRSPCLIVPQQEVPAGVVRLGEARWGSVNSFRTIHWYTPSGTIFFPNTKTTGPVTVETETGPPSLVNSKAKKRGS